jgi:hypothetical protein
VINFHLLYFYYLRGTYPVLFCTIQTVGDGDCVWAGGAAGDIDVSSDEYFDLQSTHRGDGLSHPADLSSSPSVSIEIKKRVMRIFDSSIALCTVSLLPLLLHPGTVTERWFELCSPAGGTRCGMLLLRLLLVLHDDIPHASGPSLASVSESVSSASSYGGLLMSHGPVSDFQDIDLSTPSKQTSGISISRSSSSSSSSIRDNSSSRSSGWTGNNGLESNNGRSNDDFSISSNLTPSKTSETTPSGRKSPVPMLIPMQPQTTTMSLIRPDPSAPTPLRRRGPLSTSPTTPVMSTISLPLSPSTTSTVTSTSMTPSQSAVSVIAVTPPPISFIVENNQGSAVTDTLQSDTRKSLECTVPDRTSPELYNSTVQHTTQAVSDRCQGAVRAALDSPSSPPKGSIMLGERALYGSPDDITLRQRRGGAVSNEKNSRRSSRSVSPSSDSDSRGSKKKSRIKGKGKGGTVKGKAPSKALVKGKTGAGLKGTEGNAKGSLLAPVTPAGMAHWFVNISSTALGYLEKQLMDTEENSNGDVRDEGTMIADAHSSTGKAKGHGHGQDIRGEKVRGSEKMEGVGRIHVSLVSVFKALVTDAAEGDHYVVRSSQTLKEK